jgi:hypothetical protein
VPCYVGVSDGGSLKKGGYKESDVAVLALCGVKAVDTGRDVASESS